MQTTFKVSEKKRFTCLADQLDQQGKLHNKQEYLDAVFAREEQGSG
ncbi:hypothetical protein OH492_28670 [Vibrio chagasii]|nr:hypothetical protein [Vibrio chagasii]